MTSTASEILLPPVPVGGLIGIVTTSKNGLYPKEGFQNIGVQKGGNDLKDIHDGFGYSYGDSDGTGVGHNGLFLQYTINKNKYQIKIDNFCSLYIRVYDAYTGSGVWREWRSVQLSDIVLAADI